MFRTILFDVDGVLLSEERYFDASALTVWEMLYSPKYVGIGGDTFDPAPQEDTIRRVRAEVFADDSMLDFVKTRGINANWDMVYLAFSYQLVCLLAKLYKTKPEEVRTILTSQIHREAIAQVKQLAQGADFTVDYAAFVADFEKSTAEKQALLVYLNEIVRKKTGIETDIFSRNSKLWDLCQETFQEWYLGDRLAADSIGRSVYQEGKKGFLDDEIPIVEPAKMAEVLAELKSRGYDLGIGTGRPRIETIEPLKAMGLLQYFNPNRIVTASDVLDAERRYPERAPLAKPQPYCYIKGMLGMDCHDDECFSLDLPIKNGEEILVVGDSVADYMAARSIGCKFAATLTGLTGQEARAKFEELQADYILDDMTYLLTIL
ncbi:HAD family hydrolase [Aneurinibacillus aneurinilyticus]|jgi:phosphoglycolate phosphatase-like HAD superfamily hydrolase|uniref:HAD family hydrolase n=2 Tax=Aneurinibacillus aneurinilyticus TaxID=1391 RepID=A0A848CNR1_ANEAE|nr:HAD family hydrolase [Aneurinibacillus aneurinilyticus]ERI10067.1 haloacid dehalogenase-like hydrolase [Aneurinibacillus aneurinilyticus ATCC 12856]MCI1693023.1 HAD hydrolase-like protein [Aneurinibacillus aneurinilyticus]MED0669920.1 HAD hydrolase-like protein [Aneurinibacillus aneurinilyticus]MED0708088.1 HAD hydrolase-like protein [Aneurinibacillus aneurinilyticus]MED0726038.1 HAD hydrolase-like protein [Aneurinibacillus aneurinilyticus]